MRSLFLGSLVLSGLIAAVPAFANDTANTTTGREGSPTVNTVTSPYGNWRCQSVCVIVEWRYPNGVKPGETGYPSKVEDGFDGWVVKEEPPKRQYTNKEQ
ncbi:hypothetical protein [Fortiea contorta]|uniref:hypothetical protein n=1 Tax=Fortiea contorta TaxID=1892405 RepID=UPI000347BED9|nr:hypothetical protein [Fortiea contorta]